MRPSSQAGTKAHTRPDTQTTAAMIARLYWGIALVQWGNDRDLATQYAEVALWLDPELDRLVGKRHGLRQLEAPLSAGVTSTPIPPGVQLYVNGEAAEFVPEVGPPMLSWLMA